MSGVLASAATVAVRGTSPAPQAPAQDEARQIPGGIIAPDAVNVVDFADLAAGDEARRQTLARQGVRPRGKPPNEGEHKEPDMPWLTPPPRGPRDFAPSSGVASPAPTLSYQGLDDISDGTFFYIPPDTDGAVGPTRVFTALNNNYRVITKTTGATVSTVAQDSFWNSVNPAGNVFDPHVVYDPYQNRFIVAAVASAESTSSSVLVGVSNSSDPGGTWTLTRYPLGTTNCTGGIGCWADYPTLGFNQSWIAIGMNMFSISSNSFVESRVTTFNYATFLSGSVPAINYFPTTDFTVRPVSTYSNSQTTLFAPAHVSSMGASYRLNTITGTASSPVYTQGGLKTHTLLSGWAAPNGDTLPQASEPGTGTIQGIDAGDARIMNAVFRNNAIWYAQTIALPRNGQLAHTAAQWVKLDTSGNDLDAGRVEDTTATSTNGGKWYAYPSIAVNANNDVLLGYTQFSSAQFPSAGYSFRSGTDAAGTMQDAAIPRSGIGFYFKTFGFGSNRWGDFSASQVDPTDDLSLWSVQEYSKAQSGTGDGSGFWSTWWVQVTPTTNFTLTVSKTGTGTGTITSNPAGINCGVTCAAGYASGQAVTLTTTPDAGSAFTGWSGDADCSDGSVTMSAALSCVASFTQQTFTLTITKTGTGTGTITSNPAGINCGATCSFAFTSGQVVALTATPSAGSIFSGWSGDADCSDGSVTMSAARSCTATFIQTYTLTVAKTGSGSGTISSGPPGISCGATCSAAFPSGQGVALMATPSAGSTFDGWSGDPDCSDGSVTMTAAHSCTATFTQTYTLTVAKTGSGSGTITTNPDGINCGATCIAAFAAGQVVALIAAPAAGSRFEGWSGDADCSDGNITMTNSRSCSAAFARIPYDTASRDFNHDGQPDLIWQHDLTHEVTVWYMGGAQGTNILAANWLNASVLSDWRIVAAADVNGDGSPDVIWQHEITRQVTVWFMGGAEGADFLGAAWISSKTMVGWHVVGVWDFNGDGHADLVWQHETTGQTIVWYLGGPDGTVFLGSATLVAAAVDWRVVAVADLNADGHADLIWQHPTTRQVTAWYLGGPQGDQFLSAAWLSSDGMPDWRVMAVADFNGDGYDDLVWQHDTTRQVTVWYMSGAMGNTYIGSQWLNAAKLPNWRLIGW